MSFTPRTDRIWEEAVMGTRLTHFREIAEAMRDHARELERELNAVLAAQDGLVARIAKLHEINMTLRAEVRK